MARAMRPLLPYQRPTRATLRAALTDCLGLSWLIFVLGSSKSNPLHPMSPTGIAVRLRGKAGSEGGRGSLFNRGGATGRS